MSTLSCYLFIVCRLNEFLRPDSVSTFCRVDLEFPKVEVRFQNLKVEASVHVGSRALPTIPNFVFNITEVDLSETYFLSII